ncbi:MAG TPA: protein kinase [Parachlamydiaceae bacterium]|nr:protein kinase [Parachlamydiaceae bacterium]
MENNTSLTLLLPYHTLGTYANVPQEKHVLIPSDEKLDLFAITRKQFEDIIDYVKDMGPISANKVIKKCDSGLPFSIVCIPRVNTIAAYILFNKHLLQMIAEGSDNRVTYAWDIDSQKAVIYRAAKKDKISDMEREVNVKLSVRKDLFVATSEIVDYVGPHADRKPKFFPPPNYLLKPKRKEISQSIVASEKRKSINQDVPKTGMILELQKRGCINFLINSDLLTPQRIFSIALDVLKGLTVLHEEFNIVHLDLKAENIVLMKDFTAKIADFGHSRYKGEKIRKEFSFDYVPPEILKLVQFKLVQEYKADYPVDIWSFGVSLIFILSGGKHTEAWKEWQTVFNKMIGNKYEKPQLVSEYISYLKHTIEGKGQLEILKIFPLLEQCLQVYPQDRITARQGVEMMEQLINARSTKYTIISNFCS